MVLDLEVDDDFGMESGDNVGLEDASWLKKGKEKSNDDAEGGSGGADEVAKSVDVDMEVDVNSNGPDKKKDVMKNNGSVGDPDHLDFGGRKGSDSDRCEGGLLEGKGANDWIAAKNDVSSERPLESKENQPSRAAATTRLDLEEDETFSSIPLPPTTTANGILHPSSPSVSGSPSSPIRTRRDSNDSKNVEIEAKKPSQPRLLSCSSSPPRIGGLELEEDDDFTFWEAEAQRETPTQVQSEAEIEVEDMELDSLTNAKSKQAQEPEGENSTIVGRGGGIASSSRLQLEEEDDFLLPPDREDASTSRSQSQCLPSVSRPLPSSLLPQLPPPPPIYLGRPLTAFSYDGERVVFQRKRARGEGFGIGKSKGKGRQSEKDEESLRQSEAFSSLAEGSMSEPIHRMMERVSKQIEEEKKGKEKRRKESENNSNQPLQPPMGPSKKSKTKTNTKSNDTSTTLWTDRYRPQKFADLLGDDRVHRLSLSFLKSWDACVFPQKWRTTNNNGRLRKKHKLNNGNAGSGGFNSGNRGGGEEEERDELGRPKEKVLLLTGPPGLGKTTLAHVVANVAGYRVMEINASDDRSSTTVTTQIRNALDSQAITISASSEVKKNKKPTCVIVDEIDGAGGGGENSFVKELVKLITTPINRGKGKNKKSQSARPLLRPIICICNDMYATALRPLRPFVKVVRFSPPTSNLIVKRLKTICENEGLKTEQKGLRDLVVGMEGDLRSSLNCLQLLKSRTDTVSAESVKTCISAMGLKDTGTSPTTVWNRLFRLGTGAGGKGGEDDGKYVDRLMRDVQTCGEYDRLAQGLFEHYPLLRHSNSFFPKALSALEWLSFYDRLDARIKQERDWELLGYVGFGFVAWYPVWARQGQLATGGERIEWPRKDYEAYTRKQAHQEIAESFSQNLPPELKNLFTSMNVVQELAPMMLRILSPDLKPINSQVVKSEDKEVMMRLVDIMLRMKLSFQIEKLEDGQLTYKLEPPIDVFIHYDGKRASDIPASRYAVRQLVSREMDAEHIRRAEGSANGSGVKPKGNEAKDIFAAYKATKPEANKKPDKETVAFDFFGRPVVSKKPKDQAPTAEIPDVLAAVRKNKDVQPPITKTAKSGSDTSKAKSNSKEKTDGTRWEPPKITYQYHEGFSNAVRLPKKVGDFI